MNTPGAPLIEVKNLVAEYKVRGTTHRAVNDISFTVNQGECVGFIGPNGAGKSTTMKTMMGFMFPTSGEVKLFGSKPGTTEARRRLGYLPEVTLYYPFMKAKELLFLYGGLQGMSRAQLSERIPPLLEQVGLGGKANIQLKEFSKGMQQRLGIAQAIIADPELLIFDELSSGLDPVGRHDLRDVLLGLKKAGRTIFFSSHELSEVESLCDRVVIINKGKVVAQAPIADLMKPLSIFEISYKSANGANPALASAVRNGDGFQITTQGSQAFNEALAAIIESGGTVLETKAVTRSLEEYFIELIRGKDAEKP
ncbi:ABC transporter ATP-binding protein [soil metagenome]